MSGRRSATRAIAAIAGAAVVALVTLAGCGSSGATFSPTGACVADGRAAGTYPDLEAHVPTSLDGVAPNTLDSGRNCSSSALGSLTAHDVHELRFAGATWDQGKGNGVSIAVLAPAPGASLPVQWVEEFYESGARAGKKTDNVTTSRPSIGPLESVFRLDVLNDLSYQTIVVWPGEDLVHVAIIATQVTPDASMETHNERVTKAVTVATEADPTASGPAGS